MMKRLLLVCATALFSYFGFAQNCSEFFFSEYDEGSSQNKALEIYNPTANAKSLVGYTIKRYANGAATADTHLDLTGTVDPYDVWVVTNGQIVANEYGVIDSALWLMADQHGTGDHATCPMYFNGNDALTLETTPGGVIIDIFARIGPPDPVEGWYNEPGPNSDYTTSNYWEAWTANHGLIRKQTVLKGVTANPSPFNVALEWDSIPQDVWTNLGSHTCDCKPIGFAEYQKENKVYFFPNPVINNEVTIKATDEIVAVEMFNSVGELVVSKLNSANTGELYLQFDLTPGLYLVRTQLQDNSTVVKRIVVE
jgi:hypothetical protein